MVISRGGKMVMAHYHVGSNVAGYQPESDVFCTDNETDAVEAFRGDLRRALDALPDDMDEEFLEHDTWLHNTDLEARLGVDGWISRDVNDGTSLPTRYWIEPGKGDQADCDLAVDELGGNCEP